MQFGRKNSRRVTPAQAESISKFHKGLRYLESATIEDNSDSTVPRKEGGDFEDRRKLKFRVKNYKLGRSHEKEIIQRKGNLLRLLLRIDFSIALQKP